MGLDNLDLSMVRSGLMLLGRSCGPVPTPISKGTKLTKKTQQDNWFGDCMFGLSEEEREGA
jgi:hypothetical protein